MACGTVIALVWNVTIYAIQYVQEMRAGDQKAKRPIPIPAMEKSK
jgi:hypothetical protein